MNQKLIIPIAHDYRCNWCYLGMIQTIRLREEFEVEFQWRSYELMPLNVEFGPDPPPLVATNRPKTPSRFEFARRLQGVEMPAVQLPEKMRSHNAHLATLFVASKQPEQSFVEHLYRAYFESGENINEVDYLCELALQFGISSSEMRTSILNEQFASQITAFDAEAYASGVFNLPTLWIGDVRYAEQPYAVLKDAILKLNQL